MAALSAHIGRALRLIGVLSEGETASASQQNDALEALEGMLARWELEGVPVTMRPLRPETLLGFPDAHRNAVDAGLAVTLAPEYGRPIRPDVVAMAAEGNDRLIAAYLRQEPVQIDTAYFSHRSWLW